MSPQQPLRGVEKVARGGPTGWVRRGLASELAVDGGSPGCRIHAERGSPRHGPHRGFRQCVGGTSRGAWTRLPKLPSRGSEYPASCGSLNKGLPLRATAQTGSTFTKAKGETTSPSCSWGSAAPAELATAGVPVPPPAAPRCGRGRCRQIGRWPRSSGRARETPGAATDGREGGGGGDSRGRGGHPGDSGR